MIKIVVLTFAAGAKADTENSMQGTPLMLAVAMRNVPLIKLLLSYGADINHVSVFYNLKLIYDYVYTK